MGAEVKKLKERNKEEVKMGRCRERVGREKEGGGGGGGEPGCSVSL